jgi:GTP-binding protein YchF
MGFNCGIIGLPNVGKSTIFNALTAGHAPTAPYPFCTIDKNVGVVEVPDSRLQKLIELFKPKEIIPTILQFVDIAGLVKGASRGEGLGNKFLSHIRVVDAVAHVVRCFENENIAHVHGKVDPVVDVEVVETELILADLETLSRRREKARKMSKSGDKKLVQELKLLDHVADELNKGQAVRRISLSEEESEMITPLDLLTTKPTLFVANMGEDNSETQDNILEKLSAFASARSIPLVKISGAVEAELAELSPEEREEFIRELGLELSGLDQLILKGYEILDLITFYTVVGDKIGAWTIKKNTPASKAAGKIHTDMEKGFIKAEVISFETLINEGSEQSARSKGLVRIEGHDYQVKDGDVIHFRFNP